jgi:ketosteroid isomerase-like protein
MTTTEVATKLVNLCRQGKFLEAIDSLYARDIVSVEPAAMPPMPAEMRGLEAVRGKSVWWADNHEVHSATVVGPFVAGDRFIVNFDMDVTNKKTGKRMVMFEAGLYTVVNGKVARDEFFYQAGERN